MSLIEQQRDFRAWLAEEAAVAGARFGADARAGLAVYLNNYRSQLMACLAESYPAVRVWLGDAAFDAAAAHHIDATPPRSWTLDDYALGLPETLASLYPEDSEVGELAAIERALALAFVGTDAPPLDPAALAAIDWSRAALIPAPTLVSLTLGTNAAALWGALSHQMEPPPARRLTSPARLAVWRRGFEATGRELDPEESELLCDVQCGAMFEALCATLVARHGDPVGATRLGEYLARWLGEQLIVAVSEH